jgi:hypothetical protein
MEIPENTKMLILPCLARLVLGVVENSMLTSKNRYLCLLTEIDHDCKGSNNENLSDKFTMFIFTK